MPTGGAQVPLRGRAAGIGAAWRTPALALVALAVVACASTPEAREREAIWSELFWTPARECGTHFTSFAVERVQMDGTVQLIGHISLGIEDYRECYWTAVGAGIARRRAAGQPVPDWVNPRPDVELDQD